MFYALLIEIKTAMAHVGTRFYLYKKVERGQFHALPAVSTGAAYRIRTCDVLIRSQNITFFLTRLPAVIQNEKR